MNKVCIVGNGGSSICQNGLFIDECDIVIRIKNFKLQGYEKYVGSKTDIWFTKWFSFLENPIKNKLLINNTKIWLPILDPELPIINSSLKVVNDYMFTNNFHHKKVDLNLHKQLKIEAGVNNLIFLSEEELLYCLSSIGLNENLTYTKSGVNVLHPTTYLYAILLSLQRFPNHKIYITGCDGFEKGYYWNLNESKRNDKTWPHQYQKENLYIKKLIYSSKITFLQ